MDSDKPSNPSSKSGDADDLIEEMAKLMGNPSPKAEPEPETSSASHQPASAPEQGAAQSAAHKPIVFGPPETSSEPAVDEPQPQPDAAPEDAAPEVDVTSSTGSTPGWLPQNRRQTHSTPSPDRPEPDEKPLEAERREPSFALRPQSPEADTVEQRANEPEPETAPSAGWTAPAEEDGNPARFDFGLTRETPRTPEPEVPAAEPAATDDFDFGFGTTRAPEPAPVPEPPTEHARSEDYAPHSDVSPGGDDQEFDPIAALIRDQLQHSIEAPAQDAEPAPMPTDEPAAKRADSFNVPPVFGLGGDTPKRSMGGSDALDDIENLIGSAVRVDLPSEDENYVADEQPANVPAEPAPVPQPAVRPNQPRQAAPQPVPPKDVDAAEAAILAALATNGAPAASQQAGQSSVPAGDYDVDDGEPVLTESDQPRSGFRWGRIVLPLVALLLLGGVGYAGYAFLTATPPEGEAPILVADSDPNKVTPEAEETDDAAAQSPVFNSDAATDGSDEQLVSRDQSEGTDLAAGADSAESADATGDTSDDDPIRQIITADTTENGLANRRVRTVTVRPDGTIVSGDDLVAGTEALPVDRPDVPALPDDAVTSSLADTEVSGLSLDPPVNDPIPDVVDGTPANLVAVDGSSVPFPETRPPNLSALRAAAPAQSTSPVVTQPAVTATPQPDATTPAQPATVDLLGDLDGVTPAAGEGAAVTTASDPPTQPVTAAAWVQLASQRDQANANSDAGRLGRLYSSALGGRTPIVQQADLADRGTWYRVLVPASSLSEAQTICGQISNIGGDCFARAN